MTDKNIYSVHDEEGRITQSHKIFDDENGAYGRLLNDRGMLFVNHAGPTHADLDRHFVMGGELCEMQSMPVTIDRTKIGIGESDGATIKNVPKGAILTIWAGGIQFFREKIDGTQIDISAPVPGLYEISLERFPFREWRTQVVAQ